MPRFTECEANRSRTFRDTNWFAIQTKPHGEELASGYISNLGVDVFLPRTVPPATSGSTNRSAPKPLFPGYLFARFCPANCFHRVQYARGVRRVVCAGGSPVPVDEQIISIIRDRVSDHPAPTTQFSEIHPGEEVMLRDGALSGLCGIFERRTGERGRVLLLLNAIHCQARLFADRRSLQLATQAS